MIENVPLFLTGLAMAIIGMGIMFALPSGLWSNFASLLFLSIGGVLMGKSRNI